MAQPNRTSLWIRPEKVELEPEGRGWYVRDGKETHDRVAGVSHRSRSRETGRSSALSRRESGGW